MSRPHTVAPRWLLHPFMVAAFPVLSLYAANIDRFTLGVVVVPLVGVIVVSMLLLGALAWLLDWRRAGLLVSIWWLFVFSFGHLAEALATVGLRGWGLMGLWLPALLLSGWLVARTRRRLVQFTRILNFASVCLLALPLVQIVHHGLSVPSGVDEVSLDGIELEPVADPPSIYYLVVDGYARSDVLAEVFHVDNSSFVQYLRSRGFQVVEDARSNYAQTDLSLASTLNMDYLHDLMPERLRGSSSHGISRELLHRSRVFRLLGDLGYRTVSFATGFSGTELRHFDVFLEPKASLGEFETGLLQATPAALLLELGREQAAATDWWRDPDLRARLETATPHPRDAVYFDQHRQRITFALEKLVEVAGWKGPQFVMVHLVCPHPPFVFAADGRPLTPRHIYCHEEARNLIRSGDMTPEEYLQGYAGQVRYLSKRLEQVIDGILEHSRQPPIILLQADHGSGFMLNQSSLEDTDLWERFSILSAYHLPAGGHRLLYPGITPVNSFRLVLRHYFGADLNKLPDRSFFSTREQPYRFVDVTERVPDRPASDLFDVWVQDRDTFWVVGQQGAIGYRMNGRWRHFGDVTRRDLHAVAGLGPDAVWAAGAAGMLLRFDGEAWQQIPVGHDVDLNAIGLVSADELWVAGDEGLVLRLTGGRVKRVESSVDADLHGVWVNSADEVWFVGDRGTVLRWDGQHLSGTSAGLSGDWRGVWATADQVWVCGLDGAVGRRIGKRWQALDASTRADLFDLWAVAGGPLTLVGERGAVLSWNGKEFARMHSGSAFAIHAIAGQPDGLVVAVGEGGLVIERRNKRPEPDDTR